MQQQSVKPPPLWQRLQMAVQVVRVISIAASQKPFAQKVEDALINNLTSLGVAESSLQALRDHLTKMRQRDEHSRLLDIYFMGGVLIYDGILLSILAQIGAPDPAMYVAWITSAIAFPSTIGFWLIRFLKEKNGISDEDAIHSRLAFIAEVGSIMITVCLFFHVGPVIGWIALAWTLILLLIYIGYWFAIYYKPILQLLASMLKDLSNQQKQMTDAHKKL